MGNKFYKVDLHVHTPASKCYVGDKSDESYWKILEYAVKNNIKVIAITDHNTISGYEHLMKLKEETLKEYAIIQKYNISEDEKKEIKEKAELLNNVCIILGVEITLDPGVHIIVLCEENEKQELNELLDEVGFSLEKRGADDEISPNMDIKKFLENPKLDGKIILAPHVDSDKGIWKALSGQYRAEIFRSNQIDAITCNSASQLSKIQQLVCSQPEYIRKKSFAYINASDAHEPTKVGSKHSFFRLSKFDFSEIKKAMDLPEEYISDTEKPEFRGFVEKCSKSNPTIYLEKIEDLQKAMCAVLNNGHGCILLGIKENFHLSGVDCDSNQLELTIKENLKLIEIFNRRIGKIEVRIKPEKLGNGKCACVILFKDEGSCLWTCTDNEAYILDSNSFKLATLKEIERLIRSNIISEIQDFNARNNEIISKTINTMKQALHPISRYRLFSKIEPISVPLPYYFDIEYIKSLNIQEEGDLFGKGNGAANGNIYYTEFSRPRLEDCYLRYSCPVYLSQDEQYNSQLSVYNHPAIVITFGGGCHIIESAEPYYFNSYVPALLLFPKESFFKDVLSFRHIVAWLKSNLAIWLCLQKNGSPNYFSHNVVNNILLPYDSKFYKNERILELVDKILNLENKFLCDLERFEKIEDKDMITNKSLFDLSYNHNCAVNQVAYEIEELIGGMFEITDAENNLIYDDLRAEHIYIYDDKSKTSYYETSVEI